MWFILFRTFQSFETHQTVDPNVTNYGNSTTYGGSFYDPNAYAAPDPIYDGAGGDDFDNEPPLLEELGINPNHIMQKVKYRIICNYFLFQC